MLLFLFSLLGLCHRHPQFTFQLWVALPFHLCITLWVKKIKKKCPLYLVCMFWVAMFCHVSSTHTLNPCSELRIKLVSFYYLYIFDQPQDSIDLEWSWDFRGPKAVACFVQLIIQPCEYSHLLQSRTWSYTFSFFHGWLLPLESYCFSIQFCRTLALCCWSNWTWKCFVQWRWKRALWLLSKSSCNSWSTLKLLCTDMRQNSTKDRMLKPPKTARDL